MIKKTLVVKEVEALQDVICDKCGSSIAEHHKDDTYVNTSGELTLDAGWGSSFDMSKWKLDLCEECFWELFELCRGYRPNPGDELSKYPEAIRTGPW